MVTYNLKYDVTGKITGIYADAALTQLKLSFGYDENGNRITRTDYTGTTPQTTYTVYDASGNPLAIYNNTTQAEVPIYGSERLGTYSPTFNSYAYELRDNVGSVRVVISNTKTSTGQANVFTYNDYYPFGSTARSGGVTYRYEYQGAYAEKDPITGFNNFDLRMYDGRIGRWLSTDPNAQYYSPYVGMGNNPVNRVDPDGGYDTEEAAQQAAKAAGVDPSAIYNNGGKSGWGFNTSIPDGIVGHFGPSKVGGNDPTYSNINNGLGAFGIGWSAKELMIQGAIADARGISMAKVNNISNIRMLGTTGAGYMNIVKQVSRGANLLGAGMTIADGAVNGFHAHHAADLGIQAGIYAISASVPLLGWGVGSAYFLGDMYFQSTHRGMSITQYYLDDKR